jgi:GNAT superfamily N-acetyltransferase
VTGTTRVDVGVRPYEDRDEPEVLELLRAALGPGPAGERSPAFFRWKHLANPFGRSFMLVAEAGGRIVGLRAFLRWRFAVEGREVRALRAVDTATHPEHQGRGIFRRLTLEALDALRGEADLFFNTPNGRSLPGYLKMGWRVVGRVPVAVRVRRPLRFARGVRGLGSGGELAPRPRPAVEAPPAAEVLGAVRDPSVLGVPDPSGGRLATPRTERYLRWRYAEAPGLDYRAVVEGPAEAPDGLAVFRVRPRGRLWEAAVAEVLVRPGDRATAARLLRGVARAARTDHLTCSFPPGSAALGAARRRGFLPAPAGVTLVALPLREELREVATDLGRWALTLGDLEVF